MTKEIEKLEVECQVNEDDTIRLEDYPPDKQAVVSIRDEKIRDWWIAFCEKYAKKPENTVDLETRKQRDL